MQCMTVLECLDGILILLLVNAIINLFALTRLISKHKIIRGQSINTIEINNNYKNIKI
jgi:hypothetical protein